VVCPTARKDPGETEGAFSFLGKLSGAGKDHFGNSPLRRIFTKEKANKFQLL
jgi:hypothetical protein